MQFSKELMRGAAEIIVLQILQRDGEAYGYQLTRSIKQTSNTMFEFQEGTLYPLLYRLEMKDLINSTKRLAPSGKERRYYTITAQGKKVLRERTVELSSFLQALKQILPSVF